MCVCYTTGSVIEKSCSPPHRESKAYTLGLSQLLVFIAVAMNTDGFFSYQCICFIFSMIELRNFSLIKPVVYQVAFGAYRS